MSEYIYILSAGEGRYRIGIASDPQGLTERFQRDYPFTRFTLEHSIACANGHAVQLYRWIYKQLAGTCISEKYVQNASWHKLSLLQLDPIFTLTGENYVKVLPECSPVIIPLKPGMKPEELEARRRELLETL